MTVCQPFRHRFYLYLELRNDPHDTFTLLSTTVMTQCVRKSNVIGSRSEIYVYARLDT
jgi:hypothetical protein